MDTRMSGVRRTEWPRLWSDFLHMPEDFLRPLATEEIKVDEYRDDGHIVVRAEVPGIDPQKDVDLRVEEGSLMLRVERRRESKVTDRDYLREEMHYGEFARVLPLPTGCTDKDVKATYHDGILEVRIPVGKTESKRIPIDAKTVSQHKPSR